MEKNEFFYTFKHFYKGIFRNSPPFTLTPALASHCVIWGRALCIVEVPRVVPDCSAWLPLVCLRLVKSTVLVEGLV